jgi:hypothetical protein
VQCFVKTFDKRRTTQYAIPKPMQRYQNLTDQELIIPNVGVVAPNGTISSEVEINNPNLKLIINHESATPVPSAPAPVAPQPVQAAPEPSPEGEE